MRRFQIPGSHPEISPGFSKQEKRRLIALTAGTLFVGVAFLYGYWRSKEATHDPARGDAQEPAFQERVAAPEIDGASLDALVLDGAPDERVVLEGDALDQLLAVTRNVTPGQYEALGLVELTEAEHAALFEDPSVARGDAFRVRGWVDDHRSRNREGAREHIVRLRLEDGGVDGDQFVYLVAREIPEPLLEGDFLRMDGLFLKLFSDESHLQPGRWIEGPLVVGHDARRSVPAFDRVTELEPRVYADVSDDRLISEDGRIPDPSQSIPFEPLWNLMAYARDMPVGIVDWDEAAELNDQLLRSIAEDGNAHRLQPVRIPIARLQAARVLAAPDNPARIERYTEGWIGHPAWSNAIRFMGPFEEYDAEIAEHVVGRGFFLKSFSYMSADRGIRIAPFFVLESLTTVEPAPAPIFGTIITTVFIGTLVAIFGFVLLVVRDGRRSRALQQDIVRRRQERRRKRALQGQGT